MLKNQITKEIIDEVISCSKKNVLQKMKYVNKKLKINLSYHNVRSILQENRLDNIGDLTEAKEEIARLQKEIAKNQDIAHTLKIEREKEKHKTEKKISDKKYKKLMYENEELQDRIDLLLEVKSYNYESLKIEKPKTNHSESTPILVCSDWHIEENVDIETVNGLNEYNINEAEKRAMNLFKNSLKMVRSFEQETTINTMIIALLGDFISGYIHEELMEGNELSPTEAILKCKQLIRSGIDLYLSETDYDLIIPCNYGNHGRTAKEKKVATGYKNNYEWMMYRLLEQDYENESRVSFRIANGYFNYITIYDKLVRFHHGDNIKGGGGIAGITAPINNSIKRFNQGIHADLDIFGHFHQTLGGKNFVVNGSLIGTSAYGMNFGHEEPAQTLFLLNSKYGKTIHCPIYVKD